MASRLLLRAPLLGMFIAPLLCVPLLAGDEEGAGEKKPPSNVLKWSTASEVDNFGFDVYRSELREGPFERITTDPIAGAGTTDEPSQYRYEDINIDPTRAYFYYVESISMSGDRKKFTPTLEAKAKQPAD